MLTAALAATLLPLVLSIGVGASSPDPVRILLITGQNNHDWPYTSKTHKETLESTGRFRVDITEQPATTLVNADGLKAYSAFLLDYNGDRWGGPAELAFTKAVQSGTGVVVVHAANNAFRGWTEYEKMVALLWEPNVTGHGKFHPFDVTFVDKSHPITAGLPAFKDHPDELYHKLVNPQHVKFALLATAFSSTESGGTGQDEPMAIVLTYGKGRVFHTPLGHVWKDAADTRASINDPQFKTLLARGTEWAATGAVTLPTSWQPTSITTPNAPAPKESKSGAPNTLTDQEKAAGWILLFDGTSTEHFRGYKQQKFPAAGWVVEDGALHHQAGKGGGDIVTTDEYDSFEFACQWKVATGANSGIMYRVAEDHGAPYETGPEYQVLDDAAHADGKNPKTSAAALYGLIAATNKHLRPVGEWNEARIVVNGSRVEHWLNGDKVVEYELGSPEWKKLIAESKFKDMPDFGTKPKGRIDLQDHGDDVWYRNLKVRRIPAK